MPADGLLVFRGNTSFLGNPVGSSCQQRAAREKDLPCDVLGLRQTAGWELTAACRRGDGAEAGGRREQLRISIRAGQLNNLAAAALDADVSHLVALAPEGDSGRRGGMSGVLGKCGRRKRSRGRRRGPGHGRGEGLETRCGGWCTPRHGQGDKGFGHGAYWPSLSAVLSISATRRLISSVGSNWARGRVSA